MELGWGQPELWEYFIGWGWGDLRIKKRATLQGMEQGEGMDPGAGTCSWGLECPQESSC